MFVYVEGVSVAKYVCEFVTDAGRSRYTTKFVGFHRLTQGDVVAIRAAFEEDPTRYKIVSNEVTAQEAQQHQEKVEARSAAVWNDEMVLAAPDVPLHYQTIKKDKNGDARPVTFKGFCNFLSTSPSNKANEAFNSHVKDPLVGLLVAAGSRVLTNQHRVGQEYVR